MPRVLILDDHELFLEGAHLIFSIHAPEWEIIPVSDTQQALSVIHSKDIDLLLVDIDLRDDDGLNFVQHDIPEDALIPFGVLSASEDQRNIRRARSAGASGYIRKDCSGKQMVNAVKRMLAGDLVWSSQPENVDQTGLSERQLEILQLLADGKTNKEIGRQLDVSAETVKSHLKILFRKLDVSSRSECVKRAITEKLI